MKKNKIATAVAVGGVTTIGGVSIALNVKNANKINKLKKEIEKKDLEVMQSKDDLLVLDARSRILEYKNRIGMVQSLVLAYVPENLELRKEVDVLALEIFKIKTREDLNNNSKDVIKKLEDIEERVDEIVKNDSKK
ncbi:MAG: hypothetical protein ACRCX2_22530 [Paraclostridium sp.]